MVILPVAVVTIEYGNTGRERVPKEAGQQTTGEWVEHLNA